VSSELEKRFAFPIYQEGLPFACTKCGKCCTGAAGFVWIAEEEMAKMAQFLKLTIAYFKQLYVRRIGQRHALVELKSQNHSCVFYQNKLCQVYPVRPLQCKAYPFWEENLLSEQTWKQTALECEGIKADAPLIPPEIIEGYLKKQRSQGPEENYVPIQEDGRC
jgi:uncharacterized protein